MVTLRAMAAADVEAILTIQNASSDAAQWPASEWNVFCGSGEAAENEGLGVGNCAWVAEGARGVAFCRDGRHRLDTCHATCYKSIQ